jgi:hypothetical protein
MMLVQILGFGSNWWVRYGKDAKDPYRFTRQAAIYNSTGVRCGRKVRRHWVVPGLVRFNGSDGFEPGFPNSMVGKTFCCSEVTQYSGGNRLLMRRPAVANAPDRLLITLSSCNFGRVDFQSPDWKSPFTFVLAATALRNVQEIMLLTAIGDWIQTDRGFWQMTKGPDVIPTLQLLTGPQM